MIVEDQSRDRRDNEEVSEQQNQVDIIRQTKRLVAGKSEFQRFNIAKTHFFNALDYKTPRIDTLEKQVPRGLYFSYHIQTSFIWRAIISYLAYIFMYVTFFGHVHPSKTQIGIEFGFLFIFFVDLFMEIYHKKSNSLRPKSNFQGRFYFRVFSLILLLADQIIVVSTQSLPVRPFILVRCVLPVMYDPQVRKMLYALFSAYIDIIVFLIFYSTIIILFAVIANQFIELPANAQVDRFTNNYPELGKAIFVMYVLTSFDSYPDNQLVAINNRLWIYGFFIIFIFLNAIFYVTIPTNILVNSIRDVRAKTIIIDEIEQQHNLIMAFITLGGDRKKAIPYQHIVKFLLHVFNNDARSMHKITEICRNLDQKVDGTIEVSQFMQLCKIIQSKTYLRPPRYTLWKKLNIFQTYVNNQLKLKKVIQSKKFEIATSVFVFIIFVNSFLTMYLKLKVFNVIDDVIMILIIIEIFFRMIGFGIEAFFKNFLNKIDILIVIVGIVLELLPVESIPRNAAVLIKLLRIFRISLIFKDVDCLREFAEKSELYIKYSKLINQMAIIIPIVLKFFPLYMITFYFLGVIGTHIFWYQTEIKPQDSPYNNYNELSNFKSLLGTQFIFVQVLTEAGWSMVAYDHAYRFGYYALVMLYFIICHEVIVIVLTSLIKGITWQVYNSVEQEQDNYMSTKTENEKNYKNLKKKMEDIQKMKEQIESEKKLEPDTLVALELIQKKVDYEFLQKLKNIEIRSPLFHHSKRKDQNQGLNSSVKTRRQESLMNGSVHSNMSSAKNFHEIQLFPSSTNKSTSNIQLIEASMVPPSSSNLASSVKIKQIKQEDVEKEIDDLLGQFFVHSKLKYTLKIDYPQQFVDYLKHKLKLVDITLHEDQFDVQNNSFGLKASTKFLIDGIHTLLDVQTPEREQRKIVLQEMMRRGIVNEEKAKKMMTQKSEYDEQTNFDENWIIRKTYLANLDENAIRRFEAEYFSNIYGDSFKEINKVTIYPLLRIQARLTYSFANMLRYRSFDNFEFFNILSLIENKVSCDLLKRGSICKFMFQIDTNSETWFTVQLKQSNELRIHFIKNGIWLHHDGLEKDQIYVARDIFHNERLKKKDEKDSVNGYIKKLYQNFQSIALCLNNHEQFFKPNPEQQIYDLFTFYRNVEQCKRYTRRQLSVSKIMVVILSKEDTRKEKVNYKLSDIKYSEEEMQNFKQEKKKFLLDETEKQTFQMLNIIEEIDEITAQDGLPYSYIINFLTHIRQSMVLNQKNFLYQVQKLLNSSFKKNNGENKKILPTIA